MQKKTEEFEDKMMKGRVKKKHKKGLELDGKQ